MGTSGHSPLDPATGTKHTYLMFYLCSAERHGPGCKMSWVWFALATAKIPLLRRLSGLYKEIAKGKTSDSKAVELSPGKLN
jgi:hypothetical protein